MDNASSLIAASVSAVVIIGLMATYVQIMNRLIDKKHELEGRMPPPPQDIEKTFREIHLYLKLLTCQGLLFFASVFLLLFITGYLILENLKIHPLILGLSFVVIIILFVSQILHAKVYWKSYKKYICSD